MQGRYSSIECLHGIINVERAVKLQQTCTYTDTDGDLQGWLCGDVVVGPALHPTLIKPVYSWIIKVLRKTKVVTLFFALLQFPSVMAPVLDSIDAISCTCEKVLSEMTSEPITGEHYNALEVQMSKELFHLLRYQGLTIVQFIFNSMISLCQ